MPPPNEHVRQVRDGKLFKPTAEDASQYPLERRTYAADELRVDGDDDNPKLVGHAAVFDQKAELWPGFSEIVAPGAFSKSLGNDVRALFNHNPDIVLGRTRSKTLRLAEDAQGLAVEISPPPTTAARDVVEMIRRGDVSQMSFGFRTVKDRWERDEEGNVTRTLIEVELFDVSPVTFPAFPQTDVALRSLEAWQAENDSATRSGDSRVNLVRARQRMAEMDL